jgi:hypothetical protein
MEDLVPELAITDGDSCLASSLEPSQEQIGRVKPDVILEELSNIFKSAGLFS